MAFFTPSLSTLLFKISQRSRFISFKTGQNGYMTEEREEAFAEKIQQLLCDSELYNKLVEGAGDTAWRYRNEAVSWMAEYSYERVILAQKGHKNVFTHS